MNQKRIPVTIRVVAVSVAALISLGVSACCKDGDNKCPNSYSKLSADQKAGETKCTCDASNTGSGSVWGTDIYTTDSSICRAAVHAGAISASGGEVTVKGAPGCSNYVGTNRNGINAGKWGSFGSSFYFPGKGDGKCAAAPKPEPTVSDKKCPTNFKSIPSLNASTSITCTCDASKTGSGPVWGTDIYTQDSSICRAAVHAGVITSSGGSVSAKAASGCKTYKGTTRNGVKSGQWGSYGASFYFPAKGNGACL